MRSRDRGSRGSFITILHLLLLAYRLSALLPSKWRANNPAAEAADALQRTTIRKVAGPRLSACGRDGSAAGRARQAACAMHDFHRQRGINDHHGGWRRE